MAGDANMPDKNSTPHKQRITNLADVVYPLLYPEDDDLRHTVDVNTFNQIYQQHYERTWELCKQLLYKFNLKNK